MRFIEFLFETDQPEDEEYPDRTPAEEKRHQKLMKDYHKYLERETGARLSKYVMSGAAKKTTDKLKKIPKGAELVTIHGRPHLIVTPDEKQRAKIKKLIARHDKAKIANAERGTSLRAISQTVEQTKVRSAGMDAVVLEAMKNYKSAKDTGKKKNNDYLYISTYLTALKGPWPEIVPYVFKVFSWAETYWLKVFGPSKRWGSYEDFLMNNLRAKNTSAPHYACRYVETAIQGRWLRVEPAIQQYDLSTQVSYAVATKQRVEWIEPKLVEEMSAIGYTSNPAHYADSSGHRNWPEMERAAIKQGDAHTLSQYCIHVKKAPAPTIEQELIRQTAACPLNGSLTRSGSNYKANSVPTALLHYCIAFKINVTDKAILDRFVHLCHMTDVLDYAIVVKGAWPEAEHAAETWRANHNWTPQSFEKYAKKFKGGSWPKGGV